MLALCPHKETPKRSGLGFLPDQGSETPRRRNRPNPDRSNWLQAYPPIFHGPDRQKPWVREWDRYTHGD